VTIIKVPKTPKSAFDKNRPASSLLQAQIEHLEAAVGLYQPPRKRAARKPRQRTEGEAAAYIGELTRKLHPQIASPVAPPGAVVKPAGEASVEPRAHKRRPKAKKAKARKRRSRR
jgi:hypothetical protein